MNPLELTFLPGILELTFKYDQKHEQELTFKYDQKHEHIPGPERSISRLIAGKRNNNTKFNSVVPLPSEGKGPKGAAGLSI